MSSEPTGDRLQEIKAALADIRDWTKPNPFEAIQANAIPWLRFCVAELERLRVAVGILQKLAVFCDFREMQGACDFTETEMAYLAAAAAAVTDGEPQP